MALNSMILHSWLLLLSLLYVSLIPVCHSQSSSPQNIETFYPYEAPTPTPPPEPPRASPEPPPVVSRGSSSNSKIAKAVAATAAATLVVSGLIFFVIHRCLRKRRREEAAIVPQTQINGLERIEGNVRGLIVDENGLDVVYWTKFQGRSSKRDFIKEVFRRTKKKERQEEAEEEEEGKNSESFQDFPLLRGKSSTSHINILPEEDESNRYKPRIGPPASVIPKRNSSAPSLPPPQPVPSRKNPPPPPPRQPPSLKSSSKRPPTSHETPTTNGGSRNSSGEGMSVSSNGQVKLRPLHWNKANTHADHSLLRDKADRGSFGADQDLWEALFGYVAMGRRTPKGKSDTVSPSKEASPPG